MSKKPERMSEKKVETIAEKVQKALELLEKENRVYIKVDELRIEDYNVNIYVLMRKAGSRIFSNIDIQVEGKSILQIPLLGNIENQLDYAVWLLKNPEKVIEALEEKKEEIIEAFSTKRPRVEV